MLKHDSLLQQILDTLNRRVGMRRVEKATGLLSHTASLNIVICALETRNHNVEQRLLMFKFSSYTE